METPVMACPSGEMLDGVVTPAADVGETYKRVFDVVCASVLLLALVPVLLGVALLVKLSSPGPVIFRQQRVGLNGRLFPFYKFRTMVADSDPSVHRDFYKQLVEGTATASAGMFKLVEDRRVTGVGRMLRRYSLDELPQLVNVLRGDMSLVGPRPPIPYEVELYSPREMDRLRVMPGITGLWQVSGRGMLTFQDMVELDLDYIANRSLALDMLILLRTPAAILGGKGAA